MSPRQVLFITSEFPPSGAGIGVFVNNLVQALTSRGRECWVATWGKIPELDEQRRIVRIPFVPLPPLGDRLFASALRKLLKHSSLDDPVVNVHSPYPQPAAGCDVATFHIVVKNVLSYGKFTSLKRAEYKIGFPILCRNEEALLGSHTICAVSKSVATDLKTEYGFDGDVNIVGNAVDTSFFKPGRKSVEPRVLYVGRLDLNKGVLDFVRMARLVALRFPSAFFHIVGRGSALHLILREIKGLRLEKSIKLLGHVSSEALLEEYQNAWVYVSPTRFEGLATTTLEAMSCATPSIVSDIPSNRELISSAGEGWLARTGDLEELAGFVCRALGDVEQAIRVGRRARQKVLNHFTWDVVSEAYDKVLRSHLEESGQSD